MKVCTGCKLEKPISEFHRRNHGRKTPQYELRCKICTNKRKRLHRANNPNMVRAWNKKRNPGWDISRYNEYVELQGNLCAICGTDNPLLADWCCDHCHTTNKARGLLCVNCNAGLGYFKDNTDSLKSAIDYLEKWQ